MAIELYEHNLVAYEKVKAMLKTGNRACVVHPTGTGKTYIAYKLIEDNPDKIFMWIGPSSYIFKSQMMKLSKRQQKMFDRVCFNTYNWMIYNIDVIEQLKADYIILDEFHRAGAPKWQLAIQKLLKCLPEAKLLGLTATNIRYLDNQRDMAEELFSDAKASEMGLTEAMARGILPTPTYVVSVYSCEEKLSLLEEQIEKTRSEKIRKRRENLLEKLRRKLEQAEGLSAIFEKYLEGRRAKIIVFCGGIEKMYEMMSKVPEWFYGIDRMPHTYHVFSDNPEAESEFNDFVRDDSDHIRLLFCIDMLNEGVHVAGIDGVILLRATESPIVFKQQIGRALSTGSSRKPIIFDLANNVVNLNKVELVRQEIEELRGLLGAVTDPMNAFYQDTSFEIHDELKDCRTLFAQMENILDSNWEYYFTQVAEYCQRNGTVHIPRYYRAEDGLELCSWIERQRIMYCNGRLREDRRIKLVSIGINLEMVRNASFERHMKMLEEYKKQYGNLDIRVHYRTDTGDRLGLWAQNQRRNYKEGKLSEDKIKRLTAIGFPWTKPESWEITFAEVKKYYDEHGNINIPKKYRGSGGEYLADWLNAQRSALRREDSPMRLTHERIQKLDELGFVWDIEAQKQKNWEIHIQALKDFYEENGHTLVKQCLVTSEGVDLGRWVRSCRDRKKENHLSEKQIEELEACHMIWEWHDFYWDRMYEILKKFIDDGGDIRKVPRTLKGLTGTPMNVWVREQERRYFGRDNPLKPLTSNQRQRLKAVNIEARRVSSLDIGIGYLREYRGKYGHARVPVCFDTADGYSLGKWCCTKRKERRSGKLRPETIKKLDDLGFVWDYTDDYWEHMYEACKEYYEKHGNIRMPYRYENAAGDKLYTWLVSMRNRRRKQEEGVLKTGETGLSEDQIRRLDALGMRWTVTTGRISKAEMDGIKRPEKPS